MVESLGPGWLRLCECGLYPFQLAQIHLEAAAGPVDSLGLSAPLRNSGVFLLFLASWRGGSGALPPANRENHVPQRNEAASGIEILLPIDGNKIFRSIGYHEVLLSAGHWQGAEADRVQIDIQRVMRHSGDWPFHRRVGGKDHGSVSLKSIYALYSSRSLHTQLEVCTKAFEYYARREVVSCQI